jgi:SIR2-like domain
VTPVLLKRQNAPDGLSKERLPLATAAEYRERFDGSRGPFLKHFRKILEQQSAEVAFPPLLDWLASLGNLSLIVSGTYDRLLEEQLERAGRKYVIVSHVLRSDEGREDGKVLVLRPGLPPEFCAANLLCFAPDELVLYKPLGSPFLHDGLDPNLYIDTVVVTETDHALFLQRLDSSETGVPNPLRIRFRRSPLLFLGYTMDVWQYRLMMLIFQSAVRELMPKRAREQNLTARLLVHLAPPSGLKISFAVEDLSSMTGLDPAAIAAELERLSRARILRTRQHRGCRRYELEHDAFIPVLSAWRNLVLDRARRMRNIRRAVYTGLIVAAVTSSIVLSVTAQSYSTRLLLFRRALSAADPLASALALGELGDSRIAGEAVAEVRQAAAAAIPAAVLRVGSPQAPRQPLRSAWFMADGNRVATVSDNGDFKIWSADGRGKPAPGLQLTREPKLSAIAQRWYEKAGLPRDAVSSRIEALDQVQKGDRL